MDKVHYGVFRDLLRIMGINPYDFRLILEDRVEGYFPDIPERQPRIDLEVFANLIREGLDNDK